MSPSPPRWSLSPSPSQQGLSPDSDSPIESESESGLAPTLAATATTESQPICNLGQGKLVSSVIACADKPQTKKWGGRGEVLCLIKIGKNKNNTYVGLKIKQSERRAQHHGLFLS